MSTSPLSISSLHNICNVPQPSLRGGYSTHLVTIRSKIKKLIIFHTSFAGIPLPANLTNRRGGPLEISIDAILAVAAGMKEDLQRQANQAILRNDLNRGLGALATINGIDDFIYRLQIRAGSQLGIPKTPAPPRAVKSPLRRHLERDQFLRANKVPRVSLSRKEKSKP